MKNKHLLYVIFLSGILFVSLWNCKKESIKTAPTVTIAAVSEITSNSATSGGDVTSDGGVTVTTRGVCWGTSQNPTILDSKTSNGSGTGSYTSSITGLNPGITYYIKAYAKNGVGTGYSSQTTFTTVALAPVVTTTELTAITSTTATSGGNITADGGSAITARGICWGTAQNPTITNSKTEDGTGTGTFTSNLTGLIPGTTYYIKAYATNSIGTSYGIQVTLITNAVVPVLTTTAITAIAPTAATSGGIISSDGGSAVTARGVCWSTTQNPTTTNSKTVDGTGPGTYASNLTGLLPGLTYYVKAYATNSIGTNYGNQVTFTTAAIAPVLTTTAASAIATTTATSGGIISTDGGSAVTTRGVCWSTTQNPTTANSKTTDGTGAGTFISYLTGLLPGTAYYVKAYATNSIGTTYGNQVVLTTIAVAPVLTTTAASAITSTTATSGGNITSDGGSAVTARGVCWSTTPDPTTASSKTTDATGTGIFTSPITALLPNVTYYVRAYATNTIGTSYGNQMSFKTLTSIPALTTTEPSALTRTGGTGGGNITSDGGLTITERGICWSTSQNPTTGSSKVLCGTGSGIYTGTIAGLTSGTTYYMRAYATNSLGTGYGNQTILQAQGPLSQTFTDIDGNVFHAVAIGKQIWMVENLKVTRYADNTVIPYVTDAATWSTTNTGAYGWLNNDPANKSVYGGFYNFAAATSTHQIAPAGWHVPNLDEWNVLRDYLGGPNVAGGKLKEAGTNHWYMVVSALADNSTGFTGLGAGGRYSDSAGYFYFKYQAYFWSTTPNSIYAWFASLVYNSNTMIIDYGIYQRYGISIRCVKD